MNRNNKSLSGDTKYLKKVQKILFSLYPDAKSELIFKDDYQLIVSVILSAQCTDRKVNQVTPKLFKRCSSFKSLSSLRIEDLETIIRPINYFKTKARNLKGMSQMVTDSFNGLLPTTMEALLTLPGVGRKTANVILCEKEVTPSLPVDTHVQRVSRRLALSKNLHPDKVEEDLKRLFAPRDWKHLHHSLIFHGRRVCKARKPLCIECGLNKICPSSTIKKLVPCHTNFHTRQVPVHGTASPSEAKTKN